MANEPRIITGNLTRDMERRPAGSKEIVAGGVAVKDASGETTFMDVVLWIDEKSSPAVVEFMSGLAKGTPVAIRGPIKEKSWTKQTGEVVNTLSITVWDIYAGVKKGRRPEAAAPAAAAPAAPAPAAPVAEDAFKSAF